MRRNVLLLMMVLLVGAATVQASARASGLRPSRYVLDNGLAVILQENHRNPLVSLNIYVRAGGMWEDEKTNGLSHFMEHLFFRGTPSRTGAQMKQEIEGLGGQTNAETTKDYTHFYINLPGEHARQGLAIFADALINSDFDPKSMDVERQAVLDELHEDQDQPQRMMRIDLFAKAFASHPYRLAEIGTEANIKRFNQADCLAFKRKFYVPERTALVVVGDFQTDQLLPYIKETYQAYRSTGVPVPAIAPEAPLKGVREIETTADQRKASVMFGFRAPSVRDKPDIYAVDVMTFLMGQGRGSLINKTLVDQKATAEEASVDFLTQRDPGLIIVSAYTQPARVAATRTAMADLISAVRSGKFTDQDFDRARNLLVSTYIIGNETNAGKADGLGFYEMLDKMEFATTYLDGVERVTREDVVAMANKYLGQPYVYMVVKPRPQGKT